MPKSGNGPHAKEMVTCFVSISRNKFVNFEVIELLEMDQIKEIFVATFKLQFEYVDPTLITTWQIIKYRKVEGNKTSIVTVEAQILGFEPGDFEMQKIVLGTSTMIHFGCLS